MNLNKDVSTIIWEFAYTHECNYLNFNEWVEKDITFNLTLKKQLQVGDLSIFEKKNNKK